MEENISGGVNERGVRAENVPQEATQAVAAKPEAGAGAGVKPGEGERVVPGEGSRGMRRWTWFMIATFFEAVAGFLVMAELGFNEALVCAMVIVFGVEILAIIWANKEKGKAEKAVYSAAKIVLLALSIGAFLVAFSPFAFLPANMILMACYLIDRLKWKMFTVAVMALAEVVIIISILPVFWNGYHGYDALTPFGMGVIMSGLAYGVEIAAIVAYWSMRKGERDRMKIRG